MNLIEPIDIRTGRPFEGRRAHLYRPSIDGESIEGGWGRARGLLGGAFMGVMLAQQGDSPHSPDVTDYVGWGTTDMVAMWDGIRNVGATSPHDSAASTWVDLCGTGVDFALTGVSWYYDSAQFAGTSSSYGTATDSSGTIPVSAMTYEVVIKWEDTSGGSKVVFNLGKSCYAEFGKYNSILIYSTYFGPFIGRCTTAFTTGSYYGVNLSSTFTSDGLVIIDGQSITKTTADRWNRKSEFFIGNSGLNATAPFKGKIYALRVYSRQLTQQEMLDNYAVDKARFGLT